jgi:hypothetical protein
MIDQGEPAPVPTEMAGEKEVELSDEVLDAVVVLLLQAEAAS